MHGRLSGVVIIVALLGGCSPGGRDRVERQRCVLYEGVSKSIPAGGVPVTIDVPASWQRADHEDGSCAFHHPGEPGGVSLHLEFCIEVAPCDAKLSPANARTTDDIRVMDQTMRSTQTRRADPGTHRVAYCTASVQGTSITSALEARLQRLVALCDSFAIAR